MQQHRAVVAGEYDLMTNPPSGLSTDELVTLMYRDKKALDGVTMVLDGPDGVELVVDPDPAVLRESMTALLP